MYSDKKHEPEEVGNKKKLAKRNFVIKKTVHWVIIFHTIKSFHKKKHNAENRPE